MSGVPVLQCTHWIICPHDVIATYCMCCIVCVIAVVICLLSASSDASIDAKDCF